MKSVVECSSNIWKAWESILSRAEEGREREERGGGGKGRERTNTVITKGEIQKNQKEGCVKSGRHGGVQTEAQELRAISNNISSEAWLGPYFQGQPSHKVLHSSHKPQTLHVVRTKTVLSPGSSLDCGFIEGW